MPDPDKLFAPIKPADSITGTNKGGCSNSIDDNCAGSSINFNIDRDLTVNYTQHSEGALFNITPQRYVSLSNDFSVDSDVEQRAFNTNLITMTNAVRSAPDHAGLSKKLPDRYGAAPPNSSISYSYSYLEPGVNFDDSGIEDCSRTSSNLIYTSNTTHSENGKAHYLNFPTSIVSDSTIDEMFNANSLTTNNSKVTRNDGYCFMASIAQGAGEYGTIYLSFKQVEHKHPMTKYVINNRLAGDRYFSYGPRPSTADANFADSAGWPGVATRAVTQWTLELAPYIKNHLIAGRQGGYGPDFLWFMSKYSSDNYEALYWANAGTGNLINYRLNVQKYGNPGTKGSYQRHLDTCSTAYYMFRELSRELDPDHNPLNVPFGAFGNRRVWGPRLVEEAIETDFGVALRNPHGNGSWFPNFNNASLSPIMASWDPFGQEAKVHDANLIGDFLWVDNPLSYSGARLYKSAAMADGTPFNSSYPVHNLIRADFSWRPYTIIIYRGTVDYNSNSGSLSNFSNDYVEYFRLRTYDQFTPGDAVIGDGNGDGDHGVLIQDGHVVYQFPPNGIRTSTGNPDFDNYFKVNFSDNHSTTYAQADLLKIMIYQDCSSQSAYSSLDKPIKFGHPNKQNAYTKDLVFYPKWNETYQCNSSNYRNSADEGNNIAAYLNTFTEDSWHAHWIFKEQPEGYTQGTGNGRIDDVTNGPISSQEVNDDTLPLIPWEVSLKTTKKGTLTNVSMNSLGCPPNRDTFHGKDSKEDLSGIPLYCGECSGPGVNESNPFPWMYAEDDGSVNNWSDLSKGYPVPDRTNDGRGYTFTYEG